MFFAVLWLILARTYPVCQRLSRGHITRLLCFLHLHCEKSLWARAKFLDSAKPVTVPLICKHQKSGCFTDWLLTIPRDVGCFKCCDWVTITIGA